MSMFIPEVVRDCINDKMDERLVVAKHLAHDMTNEVKNFTFEGETIHFPLFDDIGDVETMTVGTALTPVRMNSTDNTAVVRQYGKAVDIYDFEQLTASGDPIGAAAAQLGWKFAIQMDRLLLEAADADCTLEATSASKTILTQDELEAGFDLFMERQNYDEFDGILVPSKLKTSFITMPGFTVNTNTYVSPNAGKIANQILGEYRGIKVYMSDMAWDSTNDEFKCYLIKHGAIAWAMKRDFMPEMDRNILKKSTTLSADLMVAGKLLRSKDLVVIHNTAF